jgi:hypothetical protein
MDNFTSHFASLHPFLLIWFPKPLLPPQGLVKLLLGPIYTARSLGHARLSFSIFLHYFVLPGKCAMDILGISPKEQAMEFYDLLQRRTFLKEFVPLEGTKSCNPAYSK